MNLTREFEFVVAAVRAVLHPHEAIRWPESADAEDVLRIASRHGVFALLAQSIERTEGVPGDTVLAARQELGRRAPRTLRLVRQLRQAVTELTAHGIDVIPVKGPVLAATAYGDVLRRGLSTDLDLMVRRRDFQRAIQVLAARGYDRVEIEIDDQEPEWESEAFLVPHDPHDVVTELHAELVGSTGTDPLDFDAVLRRTEETQLLGAVFRVLSPEDLLLYLCLHGAKHGWGRLIWIVDVAAVVASEELDWETLLDRADAIAARERLAFGVALASRLFGATAPERVRAELRLDAPHRVRSWVAARQLAATTRGQVRVRFVWQLVYEVAARETLRQRIAYLSRHLKPNARDRAWMRLPAGLGWLRWLVRPIRLATRFGMNPRA